MSVPSVTHCRPPVTHVVLIDGTMASLSEDRRSSIGQIYDLLTGKMGPLNNGPVRVHYGQGQQWDQWRTLPDIAFGRGLQGRIMAAYGWLANHYRPGDRIFLFGYSRGAFAVRSLSGLIARIGLLKPRYATERYMRLAWRYYQSGGSARILAAFHHRRCHEKVPIRLLGVFDTVMALGIRLPVLWLLTEPRYRFHDQQISDNVELGVQALALDETRAVFEPILWHDDTPGRVRQVWFRGSHADIGGQLAGMEDARPLANIPLIWMLEQAEAAGLPLPAHWQDHFPQDAGAPQVGSWRNWGKAFLMRAPRVAGYDHSETLHATVPLPYNGPALLTGHLAGLAAQKRRQRRSPRDILTRGDT